MTTARAHTNIALVKYWGKRSSARNLPATGSLSLTLDRFYTTTSVSLDAAETDVLYIDGTPANPREQERASHFISRIRDMTDRREPCRIESTNCVPTAAGLASSASGFAALALAAANAYGLEMSPRELSALAREGSGSAARSLFGGFVRMHRGEFDDGSDAIAEPIDVHANLDVSLIVVRCASGRKKDASTDAMQHTTQSSPYFSAWVSEHEADIESAQRALVEGDIAALGEVMEFSTLKMHASAMAARPGIWYFSPTTIAVMNEVKRLRSEGARAWFTMDAGPHVKVLCPSDEALALSQTLAKVPQVEGVEIAKPGPDAHLRAEAA